MGRWVKPESLQVLRAGAWFGQLDPALEAALLAEAVPKRLRSGETLHLRGAAHDGLYAVLDGMLCVSTVGPDGKEAILNMLEPPQWFGEIALFDGLPRTHNVAALTEASLLHFPTAGLEAMLAREPRWWRDMGRLMAFKLRLAFMGMEDVALYSPEVRLARRLLLLLQPLIKAPAGTPMVVPISQSHLGMMLSLSRQTTNQLLQGLQARGVLHVAYGRIEVLELMDLAAVAEVTHLDPHMLAHLVPAARA